MSTAQRPSPVIVEASATLAGMTWGKGMSVHTRRAVTDYCARHGIDAVTELKMLEGEFYIDAEYYKRKLGELRASGHVEDFWLEHIHNDERIRFTFKEDEDAPPEIKEEARRLWYHAMMKRAEFNVPEEAVAACVTYIKLPGNGHLVTGVKWGGNGTSVRQQSRNGRKVPNQIVEDNPELSVETQSIRRAMRLVTSHVTGGAMLNDIERELEQLNTEHRDDLDAVAGQLARERELRGPEPEARPLPAGHGYDELPTELPPAKGDVARVVVVGRSA